jgi:hypothetical protein
MSTPATAYESPATAKTPHVLLDPVAGSLSFSGCSVPENADGFFSPILDRVEQYAARPAARTQVLVELTYFNSSTSKYLLDVFKLLEDLHASGASRVSMDWYHPKGDLDMQEAGQDYRSLLEFPVKLVAR